MVCTLRWRFGRRPALPMPGGFIFPETTSGIGIEGGASLVTCSGPLTGPRRFYCTTRVRVSKPQDSGERIPQYRGNPPWLPLPPDRFFLQSMHHRGLWVLWQPETRSLRLVSRYAHVGRPATHAHRRTGELVASKWGVCSSPSEPLDGSCTIPQSMVYLADLPGGTRGGARNGHEPEA